MYYQLLHYLNYISLCHNGLLHCQTRVWWCGELRS